MKILKKILEEIRVVLRTATYFAIVFIILMVMKKLNLRDYNIEFTGLSQAIIGALILSKVVILMKLISLGPWVQRQPPMVDVVLRTFLYSIGVAVVILLEKAFEERHKENGFGNAITYVINNRNFYHVWATTIGVSASIFVYNSFSVVQRLMGRKGLAKLFFSTPLNQVGLHIK
jgi:hypothetical protein